MLTGLILAVARAAGETAPLMLVGVVKSVPVLPVDDIFPYLHLERKFMHLGFQIYDLAFQSADVSALRRRVGMVFQRPNPFPKSIYDNVAYGLRLQGIRDRRLLDETVENALRAAALWHEVKDRLGDNALTLSSGQQQRLVIARAIAIEPEVLLLDEPTSALDPISTLVIEELMGALKQRFTLVLVTHNMQQVARVSDYTAFIHQGKLIEYDLTDTMFTSPVQRKTEDYITGRFG